MSEFKIDALLGPKIFERTMSRTYDLYLHDEIEGPDDYIEWMANNWDICTVIISTNDKKDNKESKPILPDADIIYWDISLNQFKSEINLFIKQVINKDHVIYKDQYDKYKNNIENWIKKKYSKELNQKNNEINHRTFIDWLKKNKKNLLEYYK